MIMMLEQLLTRGRSKESVNRLVTYVGHDPQRFSSLVQLAVRGKQKEGQLASWALSYCVESYPQHMAHHYKELLKVAAKPDTTIALKRAVVRALQFTVIPIRYQGLAADVCFQLLGNKKEAVAVRVFAMTVLGNLAVQNPGLKEEVIVLIEEGLPYAKPAYLSRSKKVLKKLRQLP